MHAVFATMHIMLDAMHTMLAAMHIVLATMHTVLAAIHTMLAAMSNIKYLMQFAPVSISQYSIEIIPPFYKQTLRSSEI